MDFGGLQRCLFPILAECCASQLTEQEKWRVKILELVEIEKYIPGNRQWLGRPAAECKTIARWYAAKVVFRYPHTRILRDDVHQRSCKARSASLYCRIRVHERTKTLADDVLGKLKDIFIQARAICPASSEFKEELRTMAKRYTMESERRIHEDKASRHGIQTVTAKKQVSISRKQNESEFGDNVDLF